MEVKMQDLKDVAKELNETLGLDPPIAYKVGMKKTALIKEILEAASLLRLEDDKQGGKDNVQQSTKAILAGIGFVPFVSGEEGDLPTGAIQTPPTEEVVKTKDTNKEDKDRKVSKPKADKKPKIAKPIKPPCCTARIAYAVCDDPNATPEQIIDTVAKTGSFTSAPNTVDVYRRETLRVINYLIEKGLMKKYF